MDDHQDRSRVVYWILCLLGVATLLPWNVFITESEFFDIRVHVPPTYDKIADSAETAIVLVFQFVNFFALLVLIPLQRCIPLHQQVMTPLVLTFLVLVLAAALALWTSASGAVVIWATLISVGLMGATTALLQGGLFGLAGLCPPIYVQATSVGQAVAGFAVSVLSFLTTWAALVPEPGEERGPRDVAMTAFAYFGLSAAVVVASMAGYWMLQLIPFWLHYTSSHSGHGKGKEEENVLEEGGVTLNGRGTDEVQGPSDEAAAVDDVPLLRAAARPGAAAGLKATSSGSLAVACPQMPRRVAPVKELLWRMRWHSTSLALCFAVTIAVFPSITASICSVHNPARRPPCLPHTPYGRLSGDLFTPLLFLLFNMGDLLGRLLSGIGAYVHKSPPTSLLMGYALSRIVLAAALVFCHVVTPHAWRAPELFRSDLVPVILVLVLGVSNGHLASLASMHMPSLLPHNYRDQSGPVIAFAITAGLTAGSILALVLVAALQTHL
ncbi:g5121 [Coccomyxa viridis]|uniref:G5121 protein n=1 Tax=Coccomyxa viridis TaxID=1274662 RepID=A0ABP1FX01_9CHLO